MLPEPKKSPSRLLGWLRTKSDTFQENWSKSWKTGHVSRQRGDPWWIDMTPVQWAVWLIYLSWWASSAEQYWKFRATADPHHVLPRCVPVFLNPSASHAAARGLKWVLTCEKKNTSADKAYGQFVCESIKKLHLQKIHQYTHVNHTWAHMFFFNKRRLPLKKKSAYMRIWTCKSAHPCSSLMRLEDAMIWYYMTIYDYIYMLLYWYYFVTLSWILNHIPHDLVVNSPVQSKAPHLLGDIFHPLQRDVLTVAWFLHGKLNVPFCFWLPLGTQWRIHHLF